MRNEDNSLVIIANICQSIMEDFLAAAYNQVVSPTNQVHGFILRSLPETLSCPQNQANRTFTNDLSERDSCYSCSTNQTKYSLVKNRLFNYLVINIQPFQ